MGRRWKNLVIIVFAFFDLLAVLLVAAAILLKRFFELNPGIVEIFLRLQDRQAAQAHALQTPESVS